MILHELRGMAAGLAVDQVIHAALTIKRDVLGLVAGHLDIPHLREQILQNARVGMGKLDKLEPIGACDVQFVNLGFRCIVRKRSHSSSPAE